MDTIGVRLGLFNCGMHQSMLLLPKHLRNFKRVLAKACGTGGFHMLFLCEVGGHKKGLAAADINPQDLL